MTKVCFVFDICLLFEYCVFVFYSDLSRVVKFYLQGPEQLVCVESYVKETG